MPIESPPVSPRDLSEPIAPAPHDDSFEARWAAWQARGVAHERAVLRRAAIAIPIGIVIAAAILAAVYAR
jgi:hypothetical protein